MKSLRLIETVENHHIYIIFHLTMAQGSIELNDLDAGCLNNTAQQRVMQPRNAEAQAPNAEFSLPPVDTGKEAWLFLAACWVVEAVTFGEDFPLRAHIYSKLTRVNQGSDFPSASSKTSTAPMSRFQDLEILPSSEPLHR